jgi:hypothetical protein
MSSPTGTVTRVMMISAKSLVSSGLRQGGGQRQQRLAGAGLTEQGDEVDLRIHQQVEGEVLLAVACGDAPDGVLGVAVVDDGFEFRRLAGADSYPCLQGLRAFLPDEFIDQQVGTERTLDAVIGAAVLLPGFEALAVGIPEIRRQFEGAGVEEVGILEHLVVEVVLCFEAQRAGLDAHVDVLGDQDHRALGMLLAEEHDDADDLVVGLGGRQRNRQDAVDGFGLQEQVAGGQFARRFGQGDARAMSCSAPVTISSIRRLAWRALRATSDMPFLLASSSSSVIIGT